MSWFAQSSLRQARMPFVLSLICFVAFLQQPFNLPNFGFAYNMRYLLPWFFASLVALAAVFSRQERTSNWVAGLLLSGAIGNFGILDALVVVRDRRDYFSSVRGLLDVSSKGVDTRHTAETCADDSMGRLVRLWSRGGSDRERQSGISVPSRLWL